VTCYISKKLAEKEERSYFLMYCEILVRRRSCEERIAMRWKKS